MITQDRNVSTYLRQCYEANHRRRDRRTALLIVGVTLIGAAVAALYMWGL